MVNVRTLPFVALSWVWLAGSIEILRMPPTASVQWWLRLWVLGSWVIVSSWLAVKHRNPGERFIVIAFNFVFAPISTCLATFIVAWRLAVQTWR
jgi:hypothetical protein